jgi:CRISPR type III-associated protein (TIGR04423 family)
MEKQFMNTQIDGLEKIPDYDYKGYLWLSDRQTPEIIEGKVVFNKYLNTNPFIIEGLLWAEKEQVSIQIKHTHRYLINEICLRDFPNENQVDKKYHAHRIDGFKYLKFKQLWQAEPDENCAGFEVLTMKALVFVGFEK